MPRGHPSKLLVLLGGLLAALVLAACGTDDVRVRTSALPGPVGAAPLAARLTIGVDEQNPWMFRPGAVPGGFAAVRDEVAAIRPDQSTKRR